MIVLHGEYFAGNKASPYAIERGFLDYATLAKAFDAVENNDIMWKTALYADWNQVSGTVDDDHEIAQLYIVSNEGADILMQMGEIVFCSEELGMYVWGVTHYGTDWNYVLTDIPLNQEW